MSRTGRSAAVVAIVFLACRPAPQADRQATQVVLDSLLALHARHAVQKDVEGLLANYTEDAVVRSNHVEPLRGRAALRPFLTQFVNGGNITSLTYHTEDLAVYGDSAWQIATYEVKFQPAGQAEQSDHGSVMALWVKDASGAWRIHRDIVNSSVPLPVLVPR